MNKIILNVTAVTTLLLCIWTIGKEVKGNRVVYVDIAKVVDNYKLKKDLEKMSGGDLYRIKGSVDSLTMIKKMAGGYAPEIDSQIAYAEFTFKEVYSSVNEQINKKVWERLNPAIEEYGKSRKLEILIGGTGNGNLLYADKERDMTDDLIHYVNAKYEKGS